MHNHFNGAKTALLFGALMGIFLVFGAVIAGATGSSSFIWLFALLGVGSIAYSYWNSDKIAIRSMRAVEVTEQQAPAMYRIVRELSGRAGKPMPRLYVSPTMAPNAFATGRNPENSAVCCTQGILQLLNERELRGVLGHELMHVYNRDILTGSIAAAVAGVITSVAQMFAFTGMMGGNRNQGGNPIVALLLAFLAPLAAGLVQTAIGRTREFDADEDGAALTDDPLALASALRKLESGTQRAPLPQDQRLVNTSHLMIANPFKGGGVGRLFATHPPMDQRIARLEGMAGRPLS
ncbi:zinc metalloprotease HtpX [Arthrobacter agilis]|uniref:zinc metalloprotease HtpX n=1 Tax=Arthrobacter agilis TaxID=37921 RepID=UPI0027861CB6|nr:zinc metalloprotease HtpX [Arthrobacter agilis]MDQ0735888.1 heat shock protein HtpX [Arthrobacter agilis]